MTIYIVNVPDITLRLAAWDLSFKDASIKSNFVLPSLFSTNAGYWFIIYAFG